MKFLVSFMLVDTTVSDCDFGRRATMSSLRHEIADTKDQLYCDCGSIGEIEAAFEGFRNYSFANDELINPESKVKVMKIAALPMT